MLSNRFKLNTIEDELHLWRQIVIDLKNPVVIVDNDLSIIFLNAAAEAMPGIEQADRQLCASAVEQSGIFFPDLVTCCQISALPLFKPSQQNPTIELYIRHADGCSYAFNASSRRLFTRDQQSLGWLIEFTDTSGHKKVEAELSAYNERLEECQYLAKVGSWCWDTVNDVIHWSNGLYRVFGLDQNSPPPTYAHQSEIYTAESFSRLNQSLNLTLETGCAYQLDLDAVHTDGSMLKLISHGQVKRDITGKIIGIQGMLIDATQRYRVDEQLKQIVDTLPMPVFVKDVHNTFLRVNKAAEQQFEYSATELIGTDGSQYLNPKQLQEFLLKDQNAWECRSQSMHEESIWSEKHKENRQCITTRKPFFDNQGNPLFLITVCEDITERQRIEKSLHETIASLRAIYDNLPFLAWMKDTEGRYVQANKHWLQAVNIPELTAGNAITDFDIWPQELAEHYRHVDQEVMRNRRQIQLTESAMDGNRRIWTETIKAPVIDNQGRILGTTGLARDISESRLAMEQMNEHSERLRLASRAAAIGICEWDMNTGLANWDERMHEIFGLPNDRPVDYPTWAKTVLPSDLPSARTKVQKLIREKQEMHWEFRIHRQNDGALRYINASAIAACDKQGNVQKIIGVNLDVTEFKQIEIALLEKETHLAQAQAQAHLGSWSLDIANQELKWSDENYRIFGIAIGTHLNYDNLLTHIHPDDRDFVEQKWKAAMAGESYDIQHRILVNGKIKWIRERAELDFAGDGSLIRGVGTSQDITELKLIEKELETSRLQLRKLAARRERAREEERKRIAREIHDGLGQMLTALRMEIALLRINFGNGNPEFLANIQSLTGLLDNTIKVTREVSTKLRPTVIEMGIVPAMQWLIKTTAIQSGIEFNTFFPDSDLDMNDEAAIVVFRIVQESLNNVLKHALASKVIISLKQNSGRWLLEIIDNGIGFDSEAARNVESYGLLGIKERAYMLGGETIVTSTPGLGTHIQVLIPTHHQEKSQ